MVPYSSDSLSFVDDPSAIAQPGRYQAVTVDTGKVLESWRASLASPEWLTAAGTIRALDDLTPGQRAGLEAVAALLARGEPLPRPILGIGLFDNVEIGSGRDVFLLLTARGARRLPVHILSSNAKEFRPYLAV